jgi:uracil-DNA glycosylase
MNLTREDILRELELLPVWKLRLDARAEVPAAQPIYQIAMSADQIWGFVWLAEPALSQEAKLLFNNICLALNIAKTSQKLLDDNATFTPKICVIFGEATAQSWLKTSDNLANLRGKSHLMDNLQMVVTHDLQSLLATPALKPEVWQDLCLARSVLIPE